jgi:predicted ArsR family transcriptional regulator
MSTENRRPRGRPRPQETIDRDQAILAYLTEHGPTTRNAVAEALGLSKTVAYLSLDRLRREGRTRLCGPAGGPDAVWTTEVDQPCP